MCLPIACHNTEVICRYSCNHYAPLRDAPNLAEVYHAIDNLSAEVFERVLALGISEAVGSLLTLRQHTTHKSGLTSSQQQDVTSFFLLESEEKGKSHRIGKDANVPNQYNFDDPMINNGPLTPSRQPSAKATGTARSNLPCFWIVMLILY